MFKKTFLSLSCALAISPVAAPALAATSFYLVVPIPTAAKAPVEVITVALTGAALPSAKVDQAYGESLHSYLAVTGDSAYDSTVVSWSVVGGALPAGLTLDPVTGVVGGTPTEATTSPAPFTVRATYKGQNRQADYSVDVALNIAVNLAGTTLPKATLNNAYSESLRNYLNVTGDASFDSAAVRWSLVDSTLPAGLTLNTTTGDITGKPTDKPDAPVNFTVKAVYKGANGQAVYTLEVGGEQFNITQLVAGVDYTCAVTTEGAVKCWGVNTKGQLGDGSTLSSKTPVSVVGLTSQVTALALGRTHACAIQAGALKCWGGNGAGQLGDGSTVDRLTPTQVTGLTANVGLIATGDEHTCASLTSGPLMCWGLNSNGQLGDGSNSQRSVPVAVTGLNGNVTSLSAGTGGTCAVIAGSAKCWGLNANGVLGNGSTTNENKPVQVYGLTSGVTQISQGDIHACAIVSGGVRCWGHMNYGRLGNGGATTSSSYSAYPVQVSGLSGVTNLSAGGSFTCVTTTTDAVRCWGFNQFGMLGDGTTTHRSTPVATNGFTAGASSLRAGRSHVCALVSGQAKCWGSNSSGQFGVATPTGSLVPYDLPVGQ